MGSEDRLPTKDKKEKKDKKSKKKEKKRDRKSSLSPDVTQKKIKQVINPFDGLHGPRYAPPRELFFFFLFFHLMFTRPHVVSFTE